MANVIEITDFSAPELDVYARLTEAQLLNRFEPAKGMFIAESPKVIHRALDGGYEPVSLLMERKDITGAAREVLARCPGVPVYTADEELLCNLTGYHLTRGVLCAMRRPGRRISAPGRRGSWSWKTSRILPTWGQSSVPPPLWGWTPCC